MNQALIVANRPREGKQDAEGGDPHCDRCAPDRRGEKACSCRPPACSKSGDDDWAFLASLAANAQLPFKEALPRLLAENQLTPRPGQALYLWGFHALFGATPLPAQLFNSAALVAAALLCLLSLRELQLPPAGSFAIAATFALLPHYSTDRMWLATHQATLSMTLCFLSLYGELR